MLFICVAKNVDWSFCFSQKPRGPLGGPLVAEGAPCVCRVYLKVFFLTLCKVIMALIMISTFDISIYVTKLVKKGKQNIKLM